MPSWRTYAPTSVQWRHSAFYKPAAWSQTAAGCAAAVLTWGDWTGGFSQWWLYQFPTNYKEIVRKQNFQNRNSYLKSDWHVLDLDKLKCSETSAHMTKMYTLFHQMLVLMSWNINLSYTFQNHLDHASKLETGDNNFSPIFRNHRKTFTANLLHINLIKELNLKI